ncbi:uncharacterized protein [Aegilops tauschii subsp. strangulata]|uniref:uncharacterized protein isoform X4 n=1 Tax=Aegilops tauschii subsp. strangulata TaxID=200361 RepID=UPI003CC8D006
MSLLELSEDEETTTCSSCARPRREANLILHQAIGGEYMSVTDAGYLSVLFDVGEIIGGILAGFMSDQLDARATTACARVDDIYSHDPSVVLVTWHLEWKGLPFQFSRVWTLYRSELGPHRQQRIQILISEEIVCEYNKRLRFDLHCMRKAGSGAPS